MRLKTVLDVLFPVMCVEPCALFIARCFDSQERPQAKNNSVATVSMGGACPEKK